MVETQEEKTKIIHTLLETYKNKTKSSIIALLLKNKMMNVTQISKYVKTSRANLYRTVKEMVQDGILLSAESRIIRNYVEKYYKLNISMLDKIRYNDLYSEINKLDNESLKDVLTSVIMANSILLNTIAQEINLLEPKEMEDVITKMKEMMMLSLSTVTDKGLLKFNSMMREFIKEYEANAPENIDDENNLIMIFTFPLLGFKNII